MFGSEIGTQVAWLVPAALVLGVAGLWFARGRSGLAVRAGLTLWLGWLLVTGLTFSFMAGIFHPYYTVALAPAIGALVGIGGLVLWRHRDSLVAAGILGFATALTAALSFELLARDASWHPWLRYAVLVVGFVSAALIVGVRHLPRRVATASPRLRCSPAWPAPRRTPSRRRPPPTPARSRAPARRRPAGSDPAAAARWLRRHAPDRGTTPEDAGRRDRRHRRRHDPGDAARRRQHGRPARRQHLERRTDHAPRDRRVVVHLGRRGDRLQQRGRLPAGHAGAGDGDRRLQRLRPEPDPGAVQAVGGRGKIHYFIAQGGWRVRRGRRSTPAAAPRPRSAPGSSDTFTAKTVDGVTVYDLTTG